MKRDVKSEDTLSKLSVALYGAHFSDLRHRLSSVPHAFVVLLCKSSLNGPEAQFTQSRRLDAGKCDDLSVDEHHLVLGENQSVRFVEARAQPDLRHLLQSKDHAGQVCRGTEKHREGRGCHLLVGAISVVEYKFVKCVQPIFVHLEEAFLVVREDGQRGAYCSDSVTGSSVGFG